MSLLNISNNLFHYIIEYLLSEDDISLIFKFYNINLINNKNKNSDYQFKMFLYIVDKIDFYTCSKCLEHRFIFCNNNNIRNIYNSNLCLDNISNPYQFISKGEMYVYYESSIPTKVRESYNTNYDNLVFVESYLQNNFLPSSLYTIIQKYADTAFKDLHINFIGNELNAIERYQLYEGHDDYKHKNNSWKNIYHMDFKFKDFEMYAIFNYEDFKMLLFINEFQFFNIRKIKNKNFKKFNS